MLGIRHYRPWILCLLVLWLAGCAPSVESPSRYPSGPPVAVQDQTAAYRLPAIPFTIQAGAFSTAWRAAKYAQQLNRHGLDTYYFIDADRLYKVRFERFQTKQAARIRADHLKARGLIEAYYIVQPGKLAQQAQSRKSIGNRIVSTAQRFIGTPYRWGGESAQSGFDCSGLTMTVYRLNGLQLPRSSRSQYGTGRPVTKGALLPGDLVFFATGKKGRVSHVGIYTGNGRFIHASGKGNKIQYASLGNSYFQPRYMGARRYF